MARLGKARQAGQGAARRGGAGQGRAGQMTDRERLLDLWQSGATALAIAGELGVTRNSVIGHVQRARAKGDPRALVGKQKALPPAQSLGRVLIRKPAAKRKPQAVRVTEPRPLSVSVAAVPLVDCRPGCCRWPVSLDQRGHLFCDQPVEAGMRLQWCAEHRAIGFSARAA